MRVTIPVVAATYLASSAAVYCHRRASLHSLTPREVLRRHLTKEPEWPAGIRGVVGFWMSAAIWLLGFQLCYPLLEIGLRPFGLASFYYYYPNANGFGLLVEKIKTQSQKRQVLRLDWHRFNVNVGRPGRPYEYGGTSRHGPSIELNLPHIDLPMRGVRHWPWRQYTGVMLQSSVAKARQRAAAEAAASRVLDRLHNAASCGHADRYLALFASDGVFLGTDGDERWPVFARGQGNAPSFADYVKDRFGRGEGWTYEVLKRHVTLEANGPGLIAWFDEDLTNAKLGRCRGSGVLVRKRADSAEWAIAQYSLTMAVPNEAASDVARISFSRSKNASAA